MNLHQLCLKLGSSQLFKPTTLGLQLSANVVR